MGLIVNSCGRLAVKCVWHSQISISKYKSARSGGKGKDKGKGAAYQMGLRALHSPQTAQTPGRGRGSGGADGLRVSRDTQGKHTVVWWGCGGPHFLLDCPQKGCKPSAAAAMSDGTPLAALLTSLDSVYAGGDDICYGALFDSYSLTRVDSGVPLSALSSAVEEEPEYSALEVAFGTVVVSPKGLRCGCNPLITTAYMASICPPTEEFPGGVELLPVNHQPTPAQPAAPPPARTPSRPGGPGRGSAGLGHFHTWR
ncbi:hypothetical protein CYMTET_52183 [Cymbomonas tetramitiformis]|uniref:Uncharacterized protein n=1 Tax=Cymbomonas tetramitiformis TaxID=36881 RepID=A0AAE0BJM6_9CHLO|nr:hypothetical protein CYMTET_52183 [Cymbomonas tetramitiformis]